jgi:hypothetical protein
MPLALEFVEPSILMVHASGRVTYEEVNATIADLMAHPRLCLGVNLFADCRDVTSTLSTSELRAVARELVPLLDRGLGPIVIVSGRTFMYGVARMFSAFAEPLGFVVQAFHTMDEASEWLGERTSTAA